LDVTQRQPTYSDDRKSAFSSSGNTSRQDPVGESTVGAIPTWRRVVQAKEAALFVILLALAVAIGLKNPLFWSAGNLQDIARSTSFTLIVAVAGTVVLIAGALDLSVGSTFALGGVAAGVVLASGGPVWAGVLAGLAAGAGVGIVNACAVTLLRVPALIATLGTLYAVRGVVLVVTEGAPVFPLPAGFVELGRGQWLGMPIPVWVAAATAIVGHLILSRTSYGRRVYMVGGNESAAFLAGIPIHRVRTFAFVASGIAAALGGLLVAARVSSAQVNAGTGLELVVIAAIIIGGTSLFGGAGSILGTVIGSLLITVIENGMVLARIDPFYQNVVVGVVIIVAVAFDGWRRRQLALR
jgi:ribose transport system permease protein